MPTTMELLSWAREHATLLEADMHLQQGPGHRWWWEANRETGESRIRARAITALAFMERHAGKDSPWTIKAHEVFDKNGHSMETGARELGDALRAWADQVEAGILVIPQAEAHGVRVVAATDLMKQVCKLNEDKDVTPAAPIVLARAALELVLRSALEELGQTVPAKHSISAYSGTLHTAGMLSVQDVKNVEQMGGLRNAAAHGDFGALSRERAGLMEQQVDLFLRHLADILEQGTAVPAASPPA